MAALLAACLCLLLLLQLRPEVQSLPLTVQSLSLRHRLSVARTSGNPKSSPHTTTTTTPTASHLSVGVNNQGDRRSFWRGLLRKEPPHVPPEPSLDQGTGVIQKGAVRLGGTRGRRHAGGGGRGHGHLMRVGCVLGTCQVQNLSHRLYQLIGQIGREDSSPINPRSPHSYG